MAEIELTKTRIQAGIYEGVLTASNPLREQPALAVSLSGRPMEGLSITADPLTPGSWFVRFAVPASALTDGVQTFVFTDTGTGQTLDSFTIVTGAPLDDDMRAEIDLLRAELDMLKKAFRRHCVETG